MAKQIRTLENVKVGDEFMVYNGFSGHAFVVKCERITEKQVTIGGGKFWKADASPLGSSTDKWSRKPRLYEVCQIELKRTEFARRKRDVCKFQFHLLSDEDIEKVYQIITAHKEKQNDQN